LLQLSAIPAFRPLSGGAAGLRAMAEDGSRRPGPPPSGRPLELPPAREEASKGEQERYLAWSRSAGVWVPAIVMGLEYERVGGVEKKWYVVRYDVPGVGSCQKRLLRDSDQLMTVRSGHSTQDGDKSSRGTDSKQSVRQGTSLSSMSTVDTRTSVKRCGAKERGSTPRHAGITSGRAVPRLMVNSIAAMQRPVPSAAGTNADEPHGRRRAEARATERGFSGSAAEDESEDALSFEGFVAQGKLCVSSAPSRWSQAATYLPEDAAEDDWNERCVLLGARAGKRAPEVHPAGREIDPGRTAKAATPRAKARGVTPPPDWNASDTSGRRRPARVGAGGWSEPKTHAADVEPRGKRPDDEASDLTAPGNIERFRLKRKIGSGSFSSVYRCVDSRTGEDLAIKLEPSDSQKPQLVEEARKYKVLAGGQWVPRMHWFGSAQGYNVLVMDLLGRSLGSLLETCGGRFSLGTALTVTIQVLNCLEYIHSRDLIHRDIKPQNFAVGRGAEANLVRAIDFGLARRYRSGERHRPRANINGFVGTARYASVGAHRFEEQSRRDDVQALGFLLVYFLRGELPWQGLPPGLSKIERHKSLAAMKSETSFEALCAGFPREVVTYLGTCAGLEFTQQPDYDNLRELLLKPIVREGLGSQHFDWAQSR